MNRLNHLRFTVNDKCVNEQRKPKTNKITCYFYFRIYSKCTNDMVGYCHEMYIFLFIDFSADCT